jgi:FkbM family methyltransferase
LSIAVQLTRAQKAGSLLNALLFAGLVARSARPFSLLEVGARGGLQSRWTALHSFGWLHPIFVEADATEAREIEKRCGSCTVLPVAAGETSRPATLFLTRSPGRTSVLRPDRSAIDGYKRLGLPLDPSSYDIIEEVPIHLVPLDGIIAERGIKVDFVKTDVQGFDLNVLQGLENTLQTAANIMCEVQMLRIYERQACFDDVVDWMVKQSFKLIAFRPFGGDIFEGNAHFENRNLNDERSRFLQLIWRKLFGIRNGEINNSYSH